MLHNVLPKSGVIEGNFSDLKIGLPWQSIGFQNKVLHQSLRLLVIVYARKKLVDQLLDKNPNIKALFSNQWAHLKVIEPGDLNVICKKKILLATQHKNESVARFGRKVSATYCNRMFCMLCTRFW